MFKLTIILNDDSDYDLEGLSALDRCRQLGIPDSLDIEFRDHTLNGLHHICLELTELEARSFTGRFQDHISRTYAAQPDELSACHLRLHNSGFVVLDPSCSRDAWLQLVRKHNYADRWN